jgi:hypothetical protein
LRRQGRICPLEVHDGAPVYTFWDLGVSDSTAIWFVQFMQDNVHIVDYYEHAGVGFAHYAKVLQDKGYLYGGHYGPHDLNQREKSLGVSLRTFAHDLKVDFEVVEQHKIEERIEAARQCLRKCRINEALTYAIDVLEHYRRRKNEVLSTEELPVFQDVAASTSGTAGWRRRTTRAAM